MGVLFPSGDPRPDPLPPAGRSTPGFPPLALHARPGVVAPAALTARGGAGPIKSISRPSGSAPRAGGGRAGGRAGQAPSLLGKEGGSPFPSARGEGGVSGWHRQSAEGGGGKGRAGAPGTAAKRSASGIQAAGTPPGTAAGPAEGGGGAREPVRRPQEAGECQAPGITGTAAPRLKPPPPSSSPCAGERWRLRGNAEPGLESLGPSDGSGGTGRRICAPPDPGDGGLRRGWRLPVVKASEPPVQSKPCLV